MLWGHIHEYLTDTWPVSPWAVFSTASPCKVASPHCTVLSASSPMRSTLPLCTVFLCATQCLFTPCAHCCPTASATTWLPTLSMHLHHSAPTPPLLPSASPYSTAQLRASIALAAAGCPLVKYPTHHRAALHQQQRRTGAASGQQHRGCWGWKKAKKGGKREKEENKGRERALRLLPRANLL